MKADVFFSFSANSSVSSGKKHKVGCTVQHPRNKKTFCQNKSSAHIHALSFFGGRGWITQAALMIRNPGCGSQRLLLCRSHPAGRGPNSSSLFLPPAAVVAVAQGLFLRCLLRQRRSCSNPPSRVRLKMPGKTKNQRILYAGFFGGAKQPKSEPLPSGASLAAISSKVMVFVPSL